MRRTRSRNEPDEDRQHSALPPAGKRTSPVERLFELQATAGNEVVNRLVADTAVARRVGSVQRDGAPGKLKKPHPPAAPNPKAVAAREREKALAAAFQGSTFYYGTTGGNTTLKKAMESLSWRLGRIRALAPESSALTPGGKTMLTKGVDKFSKSLGGIRERKGAAAAAAPFADKAPIYWPGERFKAFHGQRGDGDAGAQMMDMYYGQAGTSMHEMRNPAIGKYVHESMRYEGEYDQAKSGREAYMEKYSTGKQAGREGWQRSTEENPAAMFGEEGTLTGTMEISRIIRAGIAKYGGTLVFEGKFVTNEGNFVPDAYKGDTNMEAIALFPLFAARPFASRVPFGKGTLVFHWGGREQYPEQILFTQNWKYNAKFEESQLEAVPSDSIFWKFPGPYTHWKLPAWRLVKAQRVMDHPTWIKRTRALGKRPAELQRIDKALEQFGLVRGVIEEGQLPNKVEVEKLDACRKDLVAAIEDARKQAAVGKRAAVVDELREQVSDFQAQWEPFAAMA